MRMYSHPLHNDPNLETVYTLCEKKHRYGRNIFIIEVYVFHYMRVYIFSFIFLLVSSAKTRRCLAINSYQQKKLIGFN